MAYRPFRASVFDLFPMKKTTEGYCASGCSKKSTIRFNLFGSTRDHAGKMPSRSSHCACGQGSIFRTAMSVRAINGTPVNFYIRTTGTTIYRGTSQLIHASLRQLFGSLSSGIYKIQYESEGKPILSPNVGSTGNRKHSSRGSSRAETVCKKASASFCQVA